MNISRISLIAALLLSGAAWAQEMQLQVELMGPLGSKVSHKGDRIFGRVAQPDALKGDMVEGMVTEARSGGKLRGNSVLNFRFETLQHAGQAVPISTQIVSFRNSQGRADVDEEGRIIRKGGGNTGKALGGTAAGGLIGGIAGGWKGAAIGSAVGAAASIAVIEIAADSPEIRFNPGSVVTVMAKSRSGPALTALAPTQGAEPAVQQTVAAAPPAQGAPPTAAPPASNAAQPNLVTLKAEFIPGEKTLFYDDFTDMSPDEAPPHWKVRGANLTMKEGGGVRQLSSTDRVVMTPMITGIPKNFTLEAEVVYENPGDLRATFNFYRAGSDAEALHFWTQTRTGALRVLVKAGTEQLVDTEVPCDFSRPVKEAVWVQNGRVRFYVNGQRAMDANQVEVPPLQSMRFETHMYSGAVGIRGMRIAESTPDFSRSIMASGRYVTYGILFDTDSDRLKPESAGVIKSIAAGLKSQPDLKLTIEGHTDSSGDDAHNLDLSKRRAEAVKSVLIGQFQIDAARLMAEGRGASKPVTSNDTVQGRAQNRRVEFVRM